MKLGAGSLKELIRLINPWPDLSKRKEKGELNHKRKVGKNSNTWRLKNTLLKNEWVNQEIKEELKKFMETNENENTTVQNLWDTAKAVLRGKYIAIQAFLKK